MNTGKLSTSQIWLLRAFRGLFWLFLVSTILLVIWLIFIPTPQEWPGVASFPDNLNLTNFTHAFIRHLALFNENFSPSAFLFVINGFFLTMFVHNIGTDAEDGIKNNNKIPAYTYVEWAFGSLISGIIFLSSRITNSDLPFGVLFMFAILMFAVVSYYFLYKLRVKLKDEEKKDEEKKESNITG